MFSSILLDEEIQPVDKTVCKEGFTLLIGQMNYQHWAGPGVDFTEGFEGGVRCPKSQRDVNQQSSRTILC
jgi:Fe-S cluster assembly iron-binding protein IscA